MRISYPGIGGSLGECVLCGESFCLEVLTGKSIPLIGIDGFDKDLPFHKKCVDAMTALPKPLRWEALPDGPLRREYASVYKTEENTV